MKLYALLRLRDESARLPGWLASITPHVDGVIALDHGSIDGSADLLAREPKLIELLTRPHDAPFDQAGDQIKLTEAGIRLGADWLLGVDADERLERGFGEVARARIAADRGQGHDAYALQLCDLWDRPDAFRVDGVWGEKAKTCLFRASEQHRFDRRPLHVQWASIAGPPFGSHSRIDARIYHLGMLSAGDRLARQARYRALDPDNRQQRIGYDYLTDESGLITRPIEPGREYVDVIDGERWDAVAKDPDLEENGALRRIILHHTAIADPGLVGADAASEEAHMREIEALHLERGWAALGYHLVVMPSGRVYAGRPITALGAHAAGHNRGALGIALAGDFERERPQPAAIQSLDELRAWLAPSGRPLPLIAHGDLMDTACPGRSLRETVPTDGPTSEVAAGRS